MARGSIGVRVVNNKIPRLASRLPVAYGAIVDRHGKAAERTAKQKVRVDTGDLQDSITWRMTSQTQGELTAGEGLPDIRAVVNEFGSVDMPAQPYLRPAIEQQREPFLRDCRNVERLLDQ
jgi:HK97 gp10 family phage protein